MADFKPHTPYTVPVEVLKPSITSSKGVTKKTYPATGDIVNCNVRTFGGTERVINDVVVLDNTATVETWYNPAITGDCRLMINGTPYEVKGEPENINMRNQYMLIKCEAIKGGA